MKTRAQFAVEYTFVIAILFVLLIPGIFLYYNYSTQSLKEITSSKISGIGNSIVNNAENSFYLGRGSRVTLDINMPTGVLVGAPDSGGSRIDCSDVYCEIVFALDGSEAVFSTDVTIIRWIDDGSGNPKLPDAITQAERYFTEPEVSPGNKRVVIQTYTDFVTIDIE